MVVKTVNIRDIIIPETIEKDAKNIELLTTYIDINGNISPIVINQNNKLLSGWREFMAEYLLGRSLVEVVVRNIPDEKVPEIHANLKQFNKSFDIVEHKKLFLTNMKKMTADQLCIALDRINNCLK